MDDNRPKGVVGFVKISPDRRMDKTIAQVCKEGNVQNMPWFKIAREGTNPLSSLV